MKFSIHEPVRLIVFLLRGKDMLWYMDHSRKLVQDFKKCTHPSERAAIDLTQLIGRQHFDEITLGQDDAMICRWLQMAMKNDHGFQSRKLPSRTIT